jgi:hypothetical protein
VSNPGGIDHAHAAISFEASFLGIQGETSRTLDGPVRLGCEIAKQNADICGLLRYSIPMRLSAYAKKMGVSYKTAFRWWKAGKLDAYQLDTGTVIVREPDQPQESTQVALYARVSSADQKKI